MRYGARVFFVLAACLAAAPAMGAGSLPVDAFLGHYTGTGIANSREADALNLTKRDLDVAIEKAGDGFAVAWTTVVRRAGIEAVERSSTEVTFLPTESARVFKAADRTDPAGALGYSWATIEDETLTVYIFVVDPASGVYNLHSYARTLAGPDKMRLKFTRIRTGRPQVIVEGDMMRAR